jgi:hypothetical protein
MDALFETHHSQFHPGRPHWIVLPQAYGGWTNSRGSDKVHLLIRAFARLADLQVVGNTWMRRWIPDNNCRELRSGKDGCLMTVGGHDGGASRFDARGWAGHRSFAEPQDDKKGVKSFVVGCGSFCDSLSIHKDSDRYRWAATNSPPPTESALSGRFHTGRTRGFLDAPELTQ